mgnify:CR=1 FL=1
MIPNGFLKRTKGILGALMLYLSVLKDSSRDLKGFLGEWMGCLRIPKHAMGILLSLGHQPPKLGAGQPMNSHPQRMRGTTTESQKGNLSRKGDGYGAEPITQ